MNCPSSLSNHCTHILTPFRFFKSWETKNSILFLKPCICNSSPLIFQSKRTHLSAIRFSYSQKSGSDAELGTRGSEGASNEGLVSDSLEQNQWKVEVGSPNISNPIMAKLSLSDQAFFLLAFITCTTSLAFTGLVIAAVPTLYAMGRAAISLSKLADTACEELPSTMAAIRLSGMEISDLTLELSDLSQEIADGVNKSAEAVQAAEAGIKQIGALARQQTLSMIQERASLPIISLKPVVAGAAKKTSRAVGKATKTLMSMITRGELGVENENDSVIDRVEI